MKIINWFTVHVNEGLTVQQQPEICLIIESAQVKARGDYDIGMVTELTDLSESYRNRIDIETEINRDT